MKTSVSLRTSLKLIKISNRYPHSAKRLWASGCTFPERNSSKALVRLPLTLACCARVNCSCSSDRIRSRKALRTFLVCDWYNAQRASVGDTVVWFVTDVAIINILSPFLNPLQKYYISHEPPNFPQDNSLFHTEGTLFISHKPQKSISNNVFHEFHEFLILRQQYPFLWFLWFLCDPLKNVISVWPFKKCDFCVTF